MALTTSSCMSWFFGEKGSIAGRMTRARPESQQAGMNSRREKTVASASRRYGSRKLQPRLASGESSGASRPMWQRQTTVAPDRRIAGTRPAV